MSDAATVRVTREEVAHLALLARIDLATPSSTGCADQLGVILESVARVGEVAADDVPPTSPPAPADERLPRRRRAPGAQRRPRRSSGAPAVEEERFRVPRILDEE